MKIATSFAVLASAGLLLLGSAMTTQADDYGPLKTKATSAGTVLTSPTGMTLYTYDKDAKDTSNCYGECAEYWPPVKADAADKPVGDLGIVKRKDGSLQWADGGKPLYTFVNDKKPGDVTGNNMKGVWHVVAEH